MDMIGSYRRCCVVNCPNNEKNCADRPNIKFYPFPGKYYDIERKQQWISAVNRRNPDGTLWQPSIFSRICSKHFLGGKISDIEEEPGYVPTIFPAEEKLPVNSVEYSFKTKTPVKETATKRSSKHYPQNSSAGKTLLNCKSTQVRFQFDQSKFIFSSVLDHSNTRKPDSEHKIVDCNIGYNILEYCQSQGKSSSFEETTDCAVDSDDCIDCDDDDHCDHNRYHKPAPNRRVKTEDKSCGPDGLLFSEVLIDVFNKRRKLS